MYMQAMSTKPFGKLPDGKEVFLCTLTNQKGTSLTVCNFGGHVQALCKDGIDVVLGYDDLDTYIAEDKYIGALIGRCGNRIARGRICVGGRTYQLECNDGRNHLHGGTASGFNKKWWKAEETAEGLKLTYTSPDGEGHYPGTLAVSVWYDLTDDDAVTIRYEAVSDADTICNLTNHTYFNLNGYDSGSVTSQLIQLFSDAYTENDGESLPNGTIADVSGTPMDLRRLTPIGAHIDDDFGQLRQARGYDHNWIVRRDEKAVRHTPYGDVYPMAYAVGDKTGITLAAYTSQPGVQFYTGNYLDGTPAGKNGAVFGPRSGFCLEAQYYPNALAHSHFPQPLLKKGDVWKALTIYQLGRKD